MAHILPEHLLTAVGGLPVDPLHQRQGAQLAFQVPLQVGGHRAAGVAAVGRREASAASQSPSCSADIRSTTACGGVVEPDGLQCMQTLPPAAMWKARCGPGAAHRAHSVSDGAHPAMPMARSR